MDFGTSRFIIREAAKMRRFEIHIRPGHADTERFEKVLSNIRLKRPSGHHDHYSVMEVGLFLAETLMMY